MQIEIDQDVVRKRAGVDRTFLGTAEMLTIRQEEPSVRFPLTGADLPIRVCGDVAVLSMRLAKDLRKAGQGIGAGFVPDILDRAVIDEIVKVNSADAIETSRLWRVLSRTRRLFREFVGPIG